MTPYFTLLESKLHPETEHVGAVPRAAVLDRLRHSRRVPVVVIEAPAGYGKTMVAASWTHEDGRPVGWYGLDELDNDPIAFLTYVAAALSRCGAPVDVVVDRLASPGAAAASITEALRRALAALPSPGILVLDNVELLHEPACRRALDTLADAVPKQSQLVLLTRAPLELTERADVLHITADDLRMNDSEAGTLLRSAGVAVGDDEVLKLNARCEGWPAGLYLTGLSGRAAIDRTLETSSGVDRFVADYLREELLNDLEPAQRAFLIDVAVLDRFSGPLCDAMLETTGSVAMLETLERSNTFLTALGEDRVWFRPHPLFRDLLRGELAVADPVRRNELLGRAADWYEDSGDRDAALECVIAADDRHRAAELVAVTALPAYWGGRMATLERRLDAIDDPRVLAAHPAATVLGAAIMALEGHSQHAERWARTAFDADPTVEMPDGSPASAWVATLRALLCIDGAEAMCRDAELAVDTLADGSPMRAFARILRSLALLASGDEERAATSFEDALAAAGDMQAAPGQGTALATLSFIAAAQGDIRAAEAYAERARATIEAAHLTDYLTSALVYAAEGRAALLRRNVVSARRAAENVERLVSGLTYGVPALAVFVRLELAQLQLALDNPARARELLDEIERISVLRPGLEALYARADRIRHDLNLGKSQDEGWVSVLTPAELRLLPVLASYLSFREIAERLGVSRNTVKTQAIAVYRKLDVSSRSQAVDRAREMGLLGGEIARRG